MRGLDSLIRLARWRLDEKRRALTTLQSLRADLEGQIDELDRRRRAEALFAAESDDLRFAFAAFAEAARTRFETLGASLAEVNARIETAQDEVSAAYQEAKKLELTRDKERRQARAAADRREQSALDEIALNSHHRRRMGSN